ncbi:MAG: methyltransferase domain-containing protein [Acidimicrobiales bacterium]
MTDAGCRSCGHTELSTVFDAPSVPVENSRLYADAAAARAVTRGDLVIQQCERCGFVQNSAFDPDLVVYDDDYEDSQGHSTFFQAFAGRVIDEMIDTHQLKGARALEIGCGDGDFLRRFCEASGGTGIGLDPALGRRAAVDGAVELRAESFGVGSGHFDADVVICRHTLEHVPDIADFLAVIRGELADRPDVVVYLEVPDSGRIATEAAFWDIYFEHCSYVDQVGFDGLLRRSGFEVVMSRLDYNGQYLVAHARLASPTPFEPRGDRPDFGALADSVEEWRRWAAQTEGRRCAVWAASSKAVAFLSAVPEFAPVVAVDINPAKAGRYLPGSGLAICHPDDLPGFAVDTVVVMNPVYMDEISEELARVGVEAELLGLGA